MSKSSGKKRLEELTANLTPRSRLVVSRLYGINGEEEESIWAIAKSYGVPVNRIREILGGATEKIIRAEFGL
jgi:DNA-directed RNA polymerase sigma subunit (sigma70/sigma32)